jgi:long-chain acyl-CoA synthetase
MDLKKLRRPSLRYPNIPLYEILKKTAKRIPEKVAIIDPQGKRQLTFSEIEHEANILAGTFSRWGIKKGERISFFLNNGWEFFIGFYAAMKIGAIVSPINPTYQEQEIMHQVNDAESRILLAQEELFPAIQRILQNLPTIEQIIITRGSGRAQERIFSLEQLLESSGQSDLFIPEINPKEDLAALPYSSGTAGLSKGVMMTHFNLVANAIQSMNALDAREDDVFISFLPFNHINGLNYYLCGGIFLGTTQVIMPRFEAQECLRLMEKYKVTMIFSVQPILQALLNLHDIEKHDLSSLRFIWAGAAPLAPSISRRIHEKFRVPVARKYGLSEASTTHANPIDRIKEGSVGIAVSDCEDRIMDLETGKLEVPLGEPGELAIRGPNIFQGYWKYPEDTKLALREGWLYTGDVAKMDKEGFVYILDRRKEMIKYQGYQIPPSELEAILMEHPSVKDCAVVGIPDKKAGEIPKAFIVLHDDDKVEPEKIMSFVADRVPYYKRIHQVSFISEIPKNFSGKVLRRLLREM